MYSKLLRKAQAGSLLFRTRYIFTSLIALAVLQLPSHVAAQSFPTEPVRIVVGFGSGGQADILARIISRKLGEQLGQPVIVENRPGAAGNLATELVGRSSPDGHTLLLVASSFVVNPTLFKSVTYDPVTDFVPVASLTTYPLYLVANPAAPDTVEELIAAAKATPGEINYASSGMGTSTHIAAEWFASMAGVEFTNVPYRGGGQSVRAVMAGETDIHFGGAAVLPQVKGERLKLLAVTTEKRMVEFPDVPTVAETVPGFDFVSWNGLFAPARTPPAIIKLLNEHVAKVLQDPDSIKAVNRLNADIMLATPDEFSELVKSEYAKWEKVINDVGITIE